jgi:hypothetical protein
MKGQSLIPGRNVVNFFVHCVSRMAPRPTQPRIQFLMRALSVGIRPVGLEALPHLIVHGD